MTRTALITVDTLPLKGRSSMTDGSYEPTAPGIGPPGPPAQLTDPSLA
jgi:hypothetical protein